MSSKGYPWTGGQSWLCLLCLALLAGVVYLPALLRAEFLNFDDNLFFDPVSNSEFVDGGLAQILHPARTIANVYLPVSHLSLYLDYQLTGTDPLWPHEPSVAAESLASISHHTIPVGSADGDGADVQTNGDVVPGPHSPPHSPKLAPGAPGSSDPPPNTRW